MSCPLFAVAIAPVLVLLVLHCSFVTPSSSPATTTASANLPFGDINVVVLTDVHSWIGGHDTSHEPLLNVDYGNVVSFVQLLREQEHNRDIFVVNNGDVIDGTGLSLPYPPSHLTAILEFMPWDALTIGNHELYDNVNVEHLKQQGGFVDHWNGKYLTSNVDYLTSSGGGNGDGQDGTDGETQAQSQQQPMGNRFTYLKGANTGCNILTFGFLYDFEEHCDKSNVERVEDVVQSEWFVNELTKAAAANVDDKEDGDDNDVVDAILVLAHMDVEHPLVYVLLNAMRAIVGPDMPIQFITGHTHYRGFAQLDAHATSVEAGRYLDTVGFVSFPTKQSVVDAHNKNTTAAAAAAVNNSTATNSTNHTTTAASQLFHHVFLDANMDTLKETLGVDDMTTSSGSALSSLIQQTRKDLGLNALVGCSPQHYFLAHGLDEPDSLWSLYLNKVILQSYFRYNQSKILIQSTGSFRYDLFDGNITLDDVIAVAPFEDDIYQVSQKTRGADIRKAFANVTRVSGHYMLDGKVVPLPEYAMTGTIHDDALYDLYTQSISVKFVSETLRNVTGDDGGDSTIEPRKQFHKDGTTVTTHSVWMDYITNYWKCNDEGIVRVTNRWLIVLFSATAAVVFFAFRFYNNHVRKRSERRGYDNAPVVIDEFDDMIL